MSNFVPRIHSIRLAFIASMLRRKYDVGIRLFPGRSCNTRVRRQILHTYAPTQTKHACMSWMQASQQGQRLYAVPAHQCFKAKLLFASKRAQRLMVHTLKISLHCDLANAACVSPLVMRATGTGFDLWAPYVRCQLKTNLQKDPRAERRHYSHQWD